MDKHDKFNIGQRVLLLPFQSSSRKTTGKSKGIFNELFQEEVVFIGFHKKSDNAIIADDQGRKRFCNYDDLTYIK